ncbi:MAG: prepilin peptidase [Acidobacteriota bacterium]
MVEVLVAGVTVSGVSDFMKHHVPNYITVPLALIGLAYNTYLGSWKIGLMGAVGLFIFGLLIFSLNGMGGGDVKLMTAIGSWIGLKPGLVVLTLAVAVGLIWSVVKLTKMGLLKEKVGWFFRGIYLAIIHTSINSIPGWDRLSEDITEPIPETAIPFGACLALGLWGQIGISLLCG